MKLKWRHRRREFVLQNDLLDPRKKQKTENKDLFSKTKLKWMRALLQLGPKEQREIVDTMTELEKARNLVRQYQEYRKRGLRFIAEVQKIEDDIKHHRTADSLKTKRNKILKRRQETPLYENEYYEFLSDQERNFCSKEGILPKAFLTAKEQVIVATAVGQQIETPLSDDWPGTVESWRRFINFLQNPRGKNYTSPHIIISFPFLSSPSFLSIFSSFLSFIILMTVTLLSLYSYFLLKSF